MGRLIEVDGFLKFEDKEYFFTFNNFILKIIPKNEVYVSIDDINAMFNWTKVVSVPDYLKGKLLDNNKYVYFFIKEHKNHTINTGIHEFEIYAYIESEYEDIEVERISINNEELNYFYNSANSYENVSIESTGKINIDVKEHDKVSNGVAFKFGETDINVSLDVSRNICTNSNKPLTLETRLSYDFPATKDLDFIFKLVYLTKDFLSFVSYRKNIYISKISLSKKRSDGKYLNYGELFINVDRDMVKESDDFIRQRIIKFELIEKNWSNIFQALSESKIYLNHIPYNSKDLRIITPARFVLITAAFEWEFRNIYGDIKSNENDKFKKAKFEILDFIDEKIEINKGKDKEYRKYMKDYKSLIDRHDMRLSGKIERCLKDNYNILDIFIKNLYGINEIQDIEYSQIANRLQTQRNNYAHGNIDKDIDTLVILDLIVLEWCIYALILKECRVEEKDIQRCINQLFKRNMAI